MGGRSAWALGEGALAKNGKDLCSRSTLSRSLRRLIREKACARSGPRAARGPPSSRTSPRVPGSEKRGDGGRGCWGWGAGRGTVS